MKPITDLGRRVLAHLPDWAEDEEAFVASEGGPEVSIRFYTLPDFTARLAEDIFTGVRKVPAEPGAEKPTPDELRPLTEAECKLTLDALVTEGWAYETEGRYYMTQAGFERLTAPEELQDQVPGKVTVDVAPAKAEASGLGGVSA